MRFLTTILLCLLGINGLIAQDRRDTGPIAGSLLWQISGNGLEDTSYLYGTVHLISREKFVVADRVSEAFQRCETAAFELDLTDFSTAIKMMSMLNLPDSISIWDYASDSVNTIIQDWIKDTLGSNPEQYAHQKPLALLSLIIQREIGDAMPASYDLYFAQMASGRGMEVHGLETIEEQMAVFDRIPLEEQMDWVLEAINPSTAEFELDDLMNAYLEEDLAKVTEMLLMESPELMKYGEFFLDRRNANWVPQIGRLAKQGPSFIAVGAGHLPGKMGLVVLLQEAGFQVEPVLP